MNSSVGEPVCDNISRSIDSSKVNSTSNLQSTSECGNKPSICDIETNSSNNYTPILGGLPIKDNLELSELLPKSKPYIENNSEDRSKYVMGISSANCAGSLHPHRLMSAQNLGSKEMDYSMNKRTVTSTVVPIPCKVTQPIQSKNSNLKLNSNTVIAAGCNDRKYLRTKNQEHGTNRPGWPCGYFSPSGRGLHLWCGVISLVVVYHMWVIIYRYVFAEICRHTMHIWFTLDYFADFLYLIDMVISIRTGFLEDGVMQFNTKRMRIHYINSTQFYVDCLSLLPLDFLYLSVGFNSMLRIFRLCKVYKFWQFLDRAERHSTYPNIMRSAKLLFYYLTILHWNACVFKLVNDFCDGLWDPSITERHTHANNSFMLNTTQTTRVNVSNNSSSSPEAGIDEHVYVHSVYWGLMSLISIGSLHKPNGLVAYMFLISQGILGVLLFATILGHVSNIVAHVSAGQKEFQGRLDRVKNYLSMRRVPYSLQEKVIDWFDYLWYTNKITDEENVLTSLPDKLKAEIAIQMHLDTLKRVEIFQNTEEGFLSELVLRLRMVLFAPGDYVCRKGEIGKQMFIVNRGTLHVLGDDGRSVLATLRAGSYFGELSILNLGRYGNRRTASVRSLGYSDLFRLSKSDLWDVLKEYPAARRKLESHAYKKISDYKVSVPGGVRDSAYKRRIMVDEDSTLCAPSNNCVGPSATNSTFNSDNYFARQRRSYTCGALHSSGDGSDGYGSDPSRLSTSVFSPQQSPTPPVSQVPDYVCSLQENLSESSAHPVRNERQMNAYRYFQKNLNSLPETVPLEDRSNPPIQIGESLGGCSSRISRATSFTNNCNLAFHMPNQQPLDRGLLTCAIDHHIRPCGGSNFGGEVSLPRMRNFSVPADLVNRGSSVPLIGYMGANVFDEPGFCSLDTGTHNFSTMCLPRGDSLVLSEGNPQQHSSTVRFNLDDYEDTHNAKEISDYESGNMTNELNHGSEMIRSNTGTVPSICFEGASNSSSSQSPSLEPRYSAHSVPPSFCPFQPTEISVDGNWEPVQLLNVPRLRPSTSASTRPPWPRICQPFSMVPGCPNTCQNTAQYFTPSTTSYDMMKEFNRLRQKIHMLECENALLHKRSRRTSLEFTVRSGMNVLDNSVSRVKPMVEVPVSRTTVKRSTSLQVPMHEKRHRTRVSNKPTVTSSTELEPLNNSTTEFPSPVNQ